MFYTIRRLLGLTTPLEDACVASTRTIIREERLYKRLKRDGYSYFNGVIIWECGKKAFLIGHIEASIMAKENGMYNAETLVRFMKRMQEQDEHINGEIEIYGKRK